MDRRSRGGLLGVAAFATAAVLLISAVPAYAAPTPGDDESDRLSVDEILKLTVNDQLIATAEALKDVGVLGPDAELAKLVAQLKLSGAGDLEVWYFDGRTEHSAAVADALANVGSTPLAIVPVPVSFDLKEVSELARQISEDGHSALRGLGVTSVNSVEIDNETGQITVFTDDAVADTARGAHLPFNLEAGGEVDFQSRARTP